MKTNSPLYYGLTSSLEAFEIATHVCDVVGHGRHNNAVNMLLETASVETDLGRFKDPTPTSAGAGLTQGDPIGILDVATRTRAKDVALIYKAFDINTISLCAEDLYTSPLHAFVFTRCFYKLIPDEFPQTLRGRAVYWKRFYNTKVGGGTTEKYVQKSVRYLYGPNTELSSLFNKRNSK